MTEQALRKYMREQQRKWQLSHWKITLLLDSEISEERAGSIGWSTDYHAATIRVNPETPESEQLITIRHELLHLLLEGHKDCTGRRDPMYERALNILSAENVA